MDRVSRRGVFGVLAAAVAAVTGAPGAGSPAQPFRPLGRFAAGRLNGLGDQPLWDFYNARRGAQLMSEAMSGHPVVFGWDVWPADPPIVIDAPPVLERLMVGGFDARTLQALTDTLGMPGRALEEFDPWYVPG